MKDKNAGKSLRSQLWDWLKEITPRPNVEDYCQIMVDSVAIVKVRIFTHDYRYSIFATSRPDDPDNLQKALLSCTATRRKSLAGLTDHLYANLVDGQFSRVTWELIKTAILRFELVKIMAKARGEQWQKMNSHYEIGGEQFYGEWFQRGKETRDHKAYKLFATGDESVLKEPIIEHLHEEIKKEGKRRGE